MRRTTASLSSILGVALTLAGIVAPAVARTTGKESIQGTIVASSKAGTRTVVSSMIVASGAFAGVGRDLEIASRPGDPQNANRDDLVFSRGRMHLLGTSRPPKISVNRQTCAITARVKQTATIQGGTGRFRHASGMFTGTLRAWGVAARNADGTCSRQVAFLLEVDVFSMHGTLSL